MCLLIILDQPEIYTSLSSLYWFLGRCHSFACDNMRFTTFLAGAFAATAVMAHPGHDHTAEMLERRQFLQNKPRDLSHCAEKLKRNGLELRAAERRAKRALDLMNQRAPGSSSINSMREHFCIAFGAPS